MDTVIAQIRQELNDIADPGIQQSAKRYFKEEIRCYGAKTATVTALARKHWKDVKNRPKKEIFTLCEDLYRSGYLEESFIVSEWVQRLSGNFEREDFAVFQRWIDSYISNWASCDGFCNHTMGEFIIRFPDCIEDLKRWTQSDNRWIRRAAAVSLIIPAKRGNFPEEAMEIASLLLTDPDDMVQKGYGWLLKEASRKHTGEIHAFVMKNKRKMPRTALRYAIELMPEDLRAEAMKKDW